VAARLQLAPRRRRLRHDLAVERKAAGDRGDLHQASGLGLRDERHRAEGRDAGDLGLERIDDRLGARREGLPRLEGEVGAEQHLSLRRDGIAQVVGK
jgi:hypothetical protein